MKIVHDAFPGQYAEVTEEQFTEVWKGKGYTEVSDDAAEDLIGPAEAHRLAATDPDDLAGQDLRDFADAIGVSFTKNDDDGKVRAKIVKSRTDPEGPAAESTKSTAQ